MPSPWSNAKLDGLRRLVSGLRSKRPGPLPVQTGFPTSLADLVVKNRTRLKKRRTPSAAHRDSGPAVRSPADGGGGLVVPAETRRLAVGRIGRGVRASAPIAEERSRRGLGLGFLVLKLVLLVALAIGGKRLVIGITGLAVGLWLLKLAGVWVLDFYRSSSIARKNSDSMMGGLELKGREMVSPIREAGVSKICSDSSESVERLDFEGLWKVSEVNGGMGSLQIVERMDFEGVRSGFEVNREAGSSKNVKTRKFFRKVFQKKSKGESAEDGKRIELSSKEEGGEEIIVEEVSSLKDSEGESNFALEDSIHEDSNESSLLSEENLDATEENASESAHPDSEKDVAIKEVVGSKKLASSRHSVFFVIVLSGLLGGKSVALVLTVSWFLVVKFINTIWRRRDDLVL